MIPSESKLLNLLSNNDVTFFIPPYQRNYEWTDDQCKVFLEDVLKTYENNDSGMVDEHFFGTITYFQTEAVFGQPNKLVLIDGQQRITTTMLFLVALRDIADDEAMKAFIDSKYLKNNNVQGDVEYKIKLKQVETDWMAYKKIILSEELTDKEKNSAVYRNYRFFYNKLTELKSSVKDITTLVEKGLNRFSVITIQLEPDKNKWENPQEIFESMNSLGKPLSLADLVRNYLFLGMNPDKQNDLYGRYWLHIERLVPGHVSDFIRDYMQAHEKKSFIKSTEGNTKELYRAFKRVFEREEATAVLKDLSECATFYSWIINGKGTEYNAIDLELKDLGVLGVTTAYSFLLVLVRAWKQNKFTAQNVVDILRTFKIYCMRRRLIHGLTSPEAKNFPMLANHVEKLARSTDKKAEFLKVLVNQENNLRLPNDLELQRVLETMNFANFKYCKFYLSLIEEKLTKSRPDQTDIKLQIEHIMPQKLNDAWRESLGGDCEAIHQDLLHTIGNITLIRHNQELGNKPFDEKKEIYENNAGLQIAKTKIVNQETWNEETIKERAEWIIKYFLDEVVPIPASMRRTNNFKVKTDNRLSFAKLQIIGEDISFVDDASIVAHVVGDTEVEFEGKNWKLSTLTKEIMTRKGLVSPSGSYRGERYWTYDGLLLVDVI